MVFSSSERTIVPVASCVTGAPRCNTSVGVGAVAHAAKPANSNQANRWIFMTLSLVSPKAFCYQEIIWMLGPLTGHGRGSRSPEGGKDDETRLSSNFARGDA